MKATQFTSRTGDEKVSGYQYIQGQHPPPPGVNVTMGLGGVVARADTVHGVRSVVLPGDWLITLPNGGVELLTDTYLRARYRRVGEDDEPDKPVKLG